MKTATRLFVVTVLWLAGAVARAQPREVDLNFVPAKTTVNFTLGDVLHTVHGSFDVKHGAVHFDPATNNVSGEILVDATSGHSGSDGRDKKMHKEVLESGRYPASCSGPIEWKDRLRLSVLRPSRSTASSQSMALNTRSRCLSAWR